MSKPIRRTLVETYLRHRGIKAVHDAGALQRLFPRQVVATADSLINRHFPDAQVDVSALEIGRDALEEEYKRTQQTILVSDTVELFVPGGFSISGDNWQAYSTAISATQLRDLWKLHQTKLMSPNIRDYLGLVKNKGNINNGIKETAKSEPENFAIYNNGITVLVNGYDIGNRSPRGSSADRVLWKS